MKKRTGKKIENAIYIIILIPLVIITASISYQSLFSKDKIPDIFGYKLFVILDRNTDSSLEYGDLAIIHNESIDKIKENDYIAYRNGINTVAINKVKKIQENYDTNSNRNKKTIEIFNMNNEVNDNTIIKEEKIEGLKVNRIPKLGLIMYDIAQPKTTILISCIILAMGGAWIYIAKAMDKKETMRLEKKVNTKI